MQGEKNSTNHKYHLIHFELIIICRFVRQLMFFTEVLMVIFDSQFYYVMQRPKERPLVITRLLDEVKRISASSTHFPRSSTPKVWRSFGQAADDWLKLPYPRWHSETYFVKYWHGQVGQTTASSFKWNVLQIFYGYLWCQGNDTLGSSNRFFFYLGKHQWR